MISGKYQRGDRVLVEAIVSETMDPNTTNWPIRVILDRGASETIDIGGCVHYSAIRAHPHWVQGAWPDNICSGYIDYSPSSNFKGGFVLRDFNHGIPVFGAVNAETFSYPGQTEEITRRLVACWNACVGVPTDDILKRGPAALSGGSDG